MKKFTRCGVQDNIDALAICSLHDADSERFITGMEDVIVRNAMFLVNKGSLLIAADCYKDLGIYFSRS